jgi:hypothetical protein
MAQPTITSLTPAIGPTAGETLVEIVGTNFRLQTTPVPSATGPSTGTLAPSVRVFFGGVEAKRVRVLSSTRLLVTTPARQAGAVVVEVRNVGPFGETIESEFVTIANGFTFAMPDYTKSSDSTRVVRALIQSLKLQVYPEVVLTQHVDFDEATGTTVRATATAKLPSLFLVGPTFRENPFSRRAFGPTQPSTGSGVIETFRAARTVDLVFSLGVISNNTVELINMMTRLTDYVRNNAWIYVQRDDADASKGFIRYEFGFDDGGDFVPDFTPNESDVRSYSGTVKLTEFDVFGIPGFDSQAMDRHPLLTSVSINANPIPFVDEESTSSSGGAALPPTFVVPVTGTVALRAGETLGGHRAVVVLADGFAYHADPFDVAQSEGLVGITTASVMLGASGLIQVVGDLIEPSWSWVPGRLVYVGPSGVLTQAHSALWRWSRAVGLATSSTSISINLGPTITQE